jgi:tetratricopeptide (TPR) repeat protein
MYLNGRNVKLNKKPRKRANPWRIIFLLVIIGGIIYFNQRVVPEIDPPFIPTVTPTLNPEIFINRAETLFKEGKLSQSIEAYRDAILANPEDSSLYVSLARVQILSGNPEAALENAELALLRSPDNPLAHAMKAWALDFIGDIIAAEISIERALSLAEKNPLAHAIYAEILIDSQEFEAAISESLLALELGPNLLETHRARGYVLYWTGNYSEAIREYQSALNINNAIPNLHLMLGYCYYANQENDKAVTSFSQANALNPTDPIPDYEISRIYLLDGIYNKDPLMVGNLGVLHFRNRSYDLALKYLSLAVRGGTTDEGDIVKGAPLSYKPKVIEIFSAYGLTLARLNMCDEAVAVFQTMLSQVAEDEIAVINANEGLSICAASIGNSEP